MAKNDKNVPRILVMLIVIVGGLWAGSLILDALVPTYDPPQTLGLAFMALLSTSLGIVAASQRDGDKHDKDDE